MLTSWGIWGVFGVHSSPFRRIKCQSVCLDNKIQNEKLTVDVKLRVCPALPGLVGRPAGDGDAVQLSVREKYFDKKKLKIF